MLARTPRNKQAWENSMADEAKAFAEGRQAAVEGRDSGANPYAPGSADHVQWQKGFEFVDRFDEDGEIPSSS
jgi:hypothetical protein